MIGFIKATFDYILHFSFSHKLFSLNCVFFCSLKDFLPREYSKNKQSDKKSKEVIFELFFPFFLIPFQGILKMII